MRCSDLLFSKQCARFENGRTLELWVRGVGVPYCLPDGAAGTFEFAVITFCTTKGNHRVLRSPPVVRWPESERIWADALGRRDLAGGAKDGLAFAFLDGGERDDGRSRPRLSRSPPALTVSATL
jgi:hypothetical protein